MQHCLKTLTTGAFLLFNLLFLPMCLAENSSNTAEESTIKVGIKHTPPFIMPSDSDPNVWQGISIELWRSIANENGWAYELTAYDLPTLLDKVKKGDIDIAVGALTVTAEREMDMDFTQPYFATGLGVAVPSQHTEAPWWRMVKHFFSLRFLHLVALLLTVLLVVGTVLWLFERRRNQEQFDNGAVKGIGSGIWWSAVTMTTVGYGDKAPVTFGGRLLGLFWMFSSLILVSSFTAAITTTLTVNHLDRPIQSLSKLSEARLGSVTDSSSMEFLRKHRLHAVAYNDLDTALKAVLNGRVEAVVYDASLLRYRLYTEYSDTLEMLPKLLMPQSYAFALPHNSPLREQTNRALLKIQAQAQWFEVMYRYLGNDDNAL